MRQKEIADALNLRPNSVSYNVKVGMPTDSIETAMAWREQRKEVKARAARVSIKAAIAMSVEKRRGCHGLGRVHTGRLDHFSAKEWIIQSPDGKRYNFSNLAEWCRQNEHLFDDDGGDYKLSLCQRAKFGLLNAAHRSGSYRGWIVIDHGPLPTTTGGRKK